MQVVLGVLGRERGVGFAQVAEVKGLELSPAVASGEAADERPVRAHEEKFSLCMPST